MKIKEGYLLREVAGSNIVVPIGEGELNFSGVITLNDVGAFDLCGTTEMPSYIKIGANVVVTGTTNGMITDLNGFSFS